MKNITIDDFYPIKDSNLFLFKNGDLNIYTDNIEQLKQYNKGYIHFILVENFCCFTFKKALCYDIENDKIIDRFGNVDGYEYLINYFK